METVEIPYKLIALLFAIVCLALGAVMLFWPNVMVTVNRMSKKWVATDSLEQSLNRTRDVDEKLFAARKIIGVILLALALFFVVIMFR